MPTKSASMMARSPWVTRLGRKSRYGIAAKMRPVTSAEYAKLGRMVLMADGLAPRVKYSAQVMNETQTAKFHLPSQSENGTEIRTVVPIANQSGMVSLNCLDSGSAVVADMTLPLWRVTGSSSGARRTSVLLRRVGLSPARRSRTDVRRAPDEDPVTLQ